MVVDIPIYKYGLAVSIYEYALYIIGNKSTKYSQCEISIGLIYFLKLLLIKSSSLNLDVQHN